MGNDTAALIASYLQSVATVVAVVIALFLQVWVTRRQRPVLSMSLSTHLADDDLTLTERPGSSGLRCYIRARVHCRTGRGAARNTQVLLMGMERPPSWGAVNPPSVGAPLKWAEVDDLSVTVPSGVWRRVDLLQLWTADVADPPLAWTALAKTAGQYPPSLRYLLREAGHYTFHLAVTADDAQPSMWRLSFEFDP
jgi:hypothetical protein